ncbi:glycoside hydrolase superfamily [Suillus subluteus]|nr:glycoside hydrolase superfamily [Suillus subluteus]
MGGVFTKLIPHNTDSLKIEPYIACGIWNPATPFVTGKTLQVSFFMRKGADCLSKWVGEAERQLRLLFEEARNCQLSIIFFDEIDGLAPTKAAASWLEPLILVTKYASRLIPPPPTALQYPQPEKPRPHKLKPQKRKHRASRSNTACDSIVRSSLRRHANRIVCKQIRTDQAVLMDSWVAAICGLLSLIQRQGQSFSTRWQWNATVGKLIDCPGRVGDWGYINTDGLGLLEYMYLCEDMEMEPIMAVWAGYSLNGASLPENELTPYIQQAIDQINFVIGNPATSEPAALRASLGHPEPFPLQYVEIGNEDFFASESYIYRWRDFVGNLTATFPQLKFIATSYPFNPILDPIPKQHLAGSQKMHSTTILSKFRNGTYYFEGEYAVVSTNASDIFGTPANGRLVYPDMQGSSAEAAFMTGLERNSDIVLAASYAPLLMNIANYHGGAGAHLNTSWQPPNVTRLQPNESTMPFHQRWRRQAKPRQAGGRGGGNRKRGPGWSASGAELSRWMGMAPADDSDSDFPTRTPRKPFGGAGVFGAGGPISAGGAGLLPGDLAAAGTPSNLGKIGDAALADADPLGVNTNVTFDEVGGLDDRENDVIDAGHPGAAKRHHQRHPS